MSEDDENRVPWMASQFDFGLVFSRIQHLTLKLRDTSSASSNARYRREKLSSRPSQNLRTATSPQHRGSRLLSYGLSPGLTTPRNGRTLAYDTWPVEASSNTPTDLATRTAMICCAGNAQLLGRRSVPTSVNWIESRTAFVRAVRCRSGFREF